jgi:predicted nucleic acid-binding protein
VTLFLDTSALMAAVGSAAGASRYVCAQGSTHGWRLISSGYCIQETMRNLGKLKPGAITVWTSLVEPNIEVVADVVSMEQALAFPKAKDRPVVISALAAKADALLTFDRTDFHGLLGPQVYGMAIRTPPEFLIDQRRAGLI